MQDYLFVKYEEKRDVYIKPMNIMIVGVGGSYPAALVAAHSIRDIFSTSNVDVTTPYTAIQKIEEFNKMRNCEWRPKYDMVIGISYSGKTPDIQDLSKVCSINKYAFALLTGAKKEELKELYCENELLKIISYFNAEDKSRKETGMISMFSTLMPAIIFDEDGRLPVFPDEDGGPIVYPTEYFEEVYLKDLENGEKFVSNLDIIDIANCIKKAPIIHVFYEWATLPTATDIETKFLESGIANVVLHEKKNYRRYTTLLKQDFALAINLTCYAAGISKEASEDQKLYKHEQDSQIAKFLKEICKSKSAQYIEIGNTNIKPAKWNIREMCKLPYLITAIAEALNSLNY